MCRRMRIRRQGRKVKRAVEVGRAGGGGKYGGEIVEGRR
jgi:hypothetical protein